MQVDYLIIGQGLCGTWLSWYLTQENRSLIVIDKNEPISASKISAGIINPVTGRRMVKVWMAEQILSFAHGGIAFGFDRLCAILGGSESIRDFIAFPKNNAGRDVMLDAPSTIDEKQLVELQIKSTAKQ